MQLRDRRARRAAAAAVLTGAALVACFVTWADAPCPSEDLVSDEILVELFPGASIDPVLAACDLVSSDCELEVGGMIAQWNFYRLLVSDVDEEDLASTVAAIVDVLEDSNGPFDAIVERAESHRLLDTPEGVQLSVPDLGVSGSPQQVQDQPAAGTIQAQQAQASFTGSGVTIAIIDTGVSFQHPLFSARLVTPGGDFAAGDGSAEAQPDDDNDDPDDDSQSDENLHHATFVAGLVHLVAPGATILPVRALDADGRGSAFALAQAILFAIEQGADVINLSATMLHDSRAARNAIEEAIAAGVVVVVAAGNHGQAIVDAALIETEACFAYPASEPATIAVAAVDPNQVAAPFTDYGPQIDISAPGSALLSSFGDDAYAEWSGTSFAAPLVAGAVALILEKYPGLWPAQVETLLTQTAQPDNNPPELEGLMGAGVLDASALAEALARDRSSLELEPSPGGTVLRWSPVLDAVTYDVVRGDVANLAWLAGPNGGQVDLGPLSCTAGGMAAPSTAAAPDATSPLPGQGFFYVFRDDVSDPLDPEAASYGRASAGQPRIPGAGDCQ